MIKLLKFIIFSSILVFQSCIKLPQNQTFKGVINIYGKMNIDNGTAYIELNKKSTTKTTNNYFQFGINSKVANSITIEIRSMDNYLDFEKTFPIEQYTLTGTFNLMPVPKNYNIIKSTQNKIKNYLKYANIELKELENKLKTIKDPKYKASVKNFIIQKKALLKKYDTELTNLLNDIKPFEKNFETGKFKSRDISRLADLNVGFLDLKSEAGDLFNDIHFLNSRKSNKFELIADYFWNPKEHTLNSIQKKELKKFLLLIKKEKEIWNKKYKDENITAYIYIECSADMNETILRTIDFQNAEKYLINNKVSIPKKDKSSDEANNQLALLRGYSVFKYIIQNHDCKKCKRAYTLVNYGSWINRLNQSMSKDSFRYAKVTYRIKN